MKWFVFFLMIPVCVYAQEDALAKGNEYYRQAQFDLAESQYRQAMKEEATNTTAQYNLANALYKQRKFKEAIAVLQRLREAVAGYKHLKNASFYNEGVIYSKQKDLENSIEAYKGALRNDPDDKQARENLQKALLELKKQQQDKQNQQKQQQPSKLSQKEAERRLQQLQQKEKDIQERLQKGGQKGDAMPKDW